MRVLIKFVFVLIICIESSTLFATSYQVTPGQCISFLADTGYSHVDTITLYNAPSHGAVTINHVTHMASYCADTGYVGNDNFTFVLTSYHGYPTVYQHVSVYHTYCLWNFSVANDSVSCGPGNLLSIINFNGGSAPYSYQWSTGDIDSFVCYPNTSQSVCVTVTDVHNCVKTSCRNNCITQIGSPSVLFCCGDSARWISVFVQGTSPPFFYSWSNGDTASTQLNHSTINVTAPGVYTVTATDFAGCWDTAVIDLTREWQCRFQDEQVSFVAPDYGVKFNVVDDSVFASGNYLWTFGDQVAGFDRAPLNRYLGCGVYYVTLVVRDSAGRQCHYVKNVNVACDSVHSFCNGKFLHYRDPSDLNTVHFVDTFYSSIATYYWDFGDGSNSSVSHPTHTYAVAGSYQVCLTVVTDSFSGIPVCTKTRCDSVFTGGPLVQDLSAELVHFSTATPGFPLYVYVGCYNRGDTVANGTLQYHYPAGTTYVDHGFNLVVDTVNRTLTRNFNNLLPGLAFIFPVKLQTGASSVLGSVLHDTLVVNPTIIDFTPLDNIMTISDTVAGSWDPNDKAACPKGDGENGVIDKGTTDISYLIRFQNTGTGPAQNIAIKDFIDSSLVLSSIKVLDASHAYTSDIAQNELQVGFRNIFLPDSGSNEEASHGYVLINAKLKPDVLPGTAIRNTARIYFDFNSPVYTNSALNTLEGFPLAVNHIVESKPVVYPNPASQRLALTCDENGVFEIYNSLGQKVKSGNVAAGITFISLQEFSPGVYYLRTGNNPKSRVSKFEVLH